VHGAAVTGLLTGLGLGRERQRQCPVIQLADSTGVPACRYYKRDRGARQAYRVQATPGGAVPTSGWRAGSGRPGRERGARAGRIAGCRTSGAGGLVAVAQPHEWPSRLTGDLVLVILLRNQQ
jgi:hypothetical protein